MGLKPQGTNGSISNGSGSGSGGGGSSGPMPSQSRISAWFAALVVLAGSVFLLEYVVFFTSDSGDHGSGARPPVQPRTAPAVPRPHLQVLAGGGAPAAPQEPPASTEVLVGDDVPPQRLPARRLAVVVPAHAGDLGKALTSLASWPASCHESTLAHTDLILYYAGGAEDDVEAVLPSLALTGGKCFANTRLVLANLTEEVCILGCDYLPHGQTRRQRAERRHANEHNAKWLLPQANPRAHTATHSSFYGE